MSSPSSASLVTHEPYSHKSTTYRQSTVDSQTSEVQDELEREEMVELLMCPSKVLQTKGDDTAAVLPAQSTNGEVTTVPSADGTEGTAEGVKAR